MRWWVSVFSGDVCVVGCWGVFLGGCVVGLGGVGGGGGGGGGVGGIRPHTSCCD